MSYQTVVGLLSLAIAMGIGRFAFTPLSPSIRDDGLLGIADGGVLASVHFLGYWLGAVSATKLRSSPKATLRISPIAIGIRTLAMGRAAMDCSFSAVIQQRFVPRSPLIERWLAALPRIAKSLETAYSKTRPTEDCDLADLTAYRGFRTAPGWFFGRGAYDAPASPRAALLAGNLDRPSQWVNINDRWYKSLARWPRRA